MDALAHPHGVAPAPGHFVARLLGRLPAPALRAYEMQPLPAAELPSRCAALLAHGRHMTAELEAHYAARVTVHVLDRVQAGDGYAREILLGLPQGQVVQYAVVDIALAHCPPAVRQDIVDERMPLGRALLPLADALEVETAGFFRVGVPPALAARFDCAVQASGYGRLVRIRRGAQTLVEGLELLTPALA